MRILTRSQTENALSIIKAKADGTNANRQARANAASYLWDFLDQTEKFSNFPLFNEERKQIKTLLERFFYNDYQRLEAAGWKHFYKSASYDCYKKISARDHIWIAIIPIDNQIAIVFERDGKPFNLQ